MPSCSSCGGDVAASANFCPSCGTARTAVCPQCGAAAAGRFCAECGTPITAGTTPPGAGVAAAAPVSERRVTTVLFGDLVGFTPLAEARDAEEVRDLLSRYFDVARTVISRYGGTVEKFVGDAVMAVWGVPTTHEDDAERAVRAGLDLVDTVTALGDDVGLSGLAMRVGIVTGEVAVTLGATGEGMVAGDPVNTAARIQTAATPGEVWVDDTTRALSAAAVVYADAGEHALKGKAQPQRLHVARQVVATVGGAQRMDGLEAAFVGRDREMRLVKELLHGTLEEGRPRLVSVVGQPGIGKTRLGWEFFKYVDGITDVVRWHRGRCLSYGETVPFWALAEIMRSRLDVIEGDDAVTVLTKLDAALDRWAADADERSWLRPRLATLVGAADAAGVSTPLAREDLFASWQLFLERLIDDEADGVALLIEDVQWADEGLLDFLDHLLERSQAPIFVLTLARPEVLERRPTWGTGRRATALYLEPLPDSAMRALVDGLVGGLTDAARDSLIARAEGVPLYAVETVRALIDRDAVVPQEGRYVLADAVALESDAGAAPTSLHTLLAARLDSLPPPERTAVQNAAVLGQSFTRGALEALTATVAGDASHVDATLDALVRKEILAIENDPRSPERGQYRFVQAMVRSVAYETLSRRDRKARHLSAAEYLAGEADADSFSAVVASHYLDARASAPDDADAPTLAANGVQLLERAGRRAFEVGAPAQAQRHYLRALEFADDDATETRLAIAAARAAITAGAPTEGVALAERGVAAAERAGLDLDAGDALAAVGEGLNSIGRGQLIPERLEPVFAALESHPDAAPVLMRLAVQIARGHFAGRGEPAAGLPWIQRAAALAEGEENWEFLCTALSGWGAMLMSTGNTTAGLGILRVALDVSREHAVFKARVAALNNLASFLAARDVQGAREYAEEGLVLVRRLGDWDSGGYLLATASFVSWLCGDWDALEPLAADTRGDAFAAAVQNGYVALGRMARGGAPVPPPEGDPGAELGPQLRAAIHLLHALVALDAGNVSAATDAALRSVESFAEFGGYDDDFPTYWTLALDLAIQEGRHDDADRWLREIADAPRGAVTPLLRAMLPYFGARLAAAIDPADVTVEAGFVAGAESLTQFGVPYWQARCLLDHAQWLAATGRGADAAPLLDRADQIFDRLGAQPWLERVEAARALTPAGRAET